MFPTPGIRSRPGEQTDLHVLSRLAVIGRIFTFRSVPFRIIYMFHPLLRWHRGWTPGLHFNPTCIKTAALLGLYQDTFTALLVRVKDEDQNDLILLGTRPINCAGYVA
jgi:hypothetical protein